MKLHILLTTALIIISYYITAQQNVEIQGKAKVTQMDVVTEGDKVVVRQADGTLAERSSLLRVSAVGDTLYNGTNWVIVPGISAANVQDGDGNVYASVVIGTQEWLIDNLRTTSYNDGTPITLQTLDADWQNAGNAGSPAYCWYNNDQATYEDPYGALYNWYVLDAASNGGKNVCPIGWHVPTDTEWGVLVTAQGGPLAAGGPLKATGTTYWNTPNTGATNISGFTALPAGSRGSNGAFNNIGNSGIHWTETETSPGSSTVIARRMTFNSTMVNSDNDSKAFGLSVRCIKD